MAWKHWSWTALTRGETSSNGNGTDVTSELQDSSLTVRPGGDNENIGGIFNGCDGTSGQHKLFPSLLQVDDVHTILTPLEDVLFHLHLGVVGSKVGGCRQHFGDIGFLKCKKIEVEKMAGEIFFSKSARFCRSFFWAKYWKLAEILWLKRWRDVLRTFCTYLSLKNFIASRHFAKIFSKGSTQTAKRFATWEEKEGKYDSWLCCEEFPENENIFFEKIFLR